jgi:hypothetical protein
MAAMPPLSIPLLLGSAAVSRSLLAATEAVAAGAEAMDGSAVVMLVPKKVLLLSPLLVFCFVPSFSFVLVGWCGVFSCFVVVMGVARRLLDVVVVAVAVAVVVVGVVDVLDVRVLVSVVDVVLVVLVVVVIVVVVVVVVEVDRVVEDIVMVVTEVAVLLVSGEHSQMPSEL